MRRSLSSRRHTSRSAVWRAPPVSAAAAAEGGGEEGAEPRRAVGVHPRTQSLDYRLVQRLLPDVAGGAEVGAATRVVPVPGAGAHPGVRTCTSTRQHSRKQALPGGAAPGAVPPPRTGPGRPRLLHSLVFRRAHDGGKEALAHGQRLGSGHLPAVPHPLLAVDERAHVGGVGQDAAHGWLAPAAPAGEACPSASSMRATVRHPAPPR